MPPWSHCRRVRSEEERRPTTATQPNKRLHPDPVVARALMRSVVLVSGVRKTYGPTVAVDDVSFEVSEGEIFGLIGPKSAFGASHEWRRRFARTAASPSVAAATIWSRT